MHMCVCVYIYGAFLMATQSEKNTIRGFRCDSMVKKSPPANAEHGFSL